MRIAARISPGLSGGLVEAEIVVARRDPALAVRAAQDVGRAERHHQRRHVVAGVAVGDVAADRPEIAHLRVGDQLGGLAQDRRMLGEQVARR